MLLLAIFLALPVRAAAAGSRAWRYGVAVGYGRQDAPPLGNRSYAHEEWIVKLVAVRPLAARGALSLDLQLEPFAGVARHRLRAAGLGPWRREREEASRLTRERTIRELGLDVGLVARWTPTPRLSLFFMGGVGPMYGDQGTERVARGFAFSDVVALGVGYRQGGLLAELRPTLRHVSNAGLRQPNSGHNSMLLVLVLSAAP